MTANKATPEELDRLATECADKLDSVPECCGEFDNGFDEPPECCGHYFQRVATYEETKEFIRQAIDQGIALAAADLIESLQKPACSLGGTPVTAQCESPPAGVPISEVSVPMMEVITTPCQGCGKRPIDFAS